MEKHKSLYQRILISVAIMLSAAILQYLIWPYIEPAPILLFYPAILLACLYGEGYTSIFLAILIVPFFSEPFGQIHMNSPKDLYRILVFIPTAFLIKFLSDKVLKLKQKADMTVEYLREEKEIREKFVSTLSHDLQTPLTSMRIATELIIKKENDPEGFKRNAERLIHNMNRLEHMIKDLLDANKIRAGKRLPLEISEMDISESISEVVNELGLIYGDRFVFRETGPLKGFWCRDAIQRILENLCTNAVKYGHSDTPITISIQRPESDQILIHVHNIGPVIEREEIEYLFEAFQQARTAQTGKKKGWGLGLTLVKGLTEAMNGRVSVSSNSSGTIFTIHLPMDARSNKEA